ncbi:AAA family ATPase [Anabaena cylindrica FACHB-243]|uniref:histidine kinase n=1 Tax=Anabaena cylindrica (strain ATCC 27899 / PCC 7122) TaxID=272123 RepID=K9ZCE3_ANACC|nr:MULTISPECIES: ATP-binding sensor histidine kinase [Anabaena]AFZ56394.1 multi-sensor signal transduction multi-kinase [Anabaena cylindrica PCC 7122]MBD2418155.1 AAA family ATPase [Anabaena cylindrica FACHB-243]MBY5282000.1 AAA family ATPase [Anabaena sp. CCAP 1446/1C]MBY5309272.1 AAA family ATPase [Anabaena sp. CCAP 1446/1C]MCM2409122.1 trifunctional serine/threonine-protein kinase/ATP-binding protein/sensor histidine kinase [Anabaena sp. CCAP 1446/1C]
MTSTFLENIPGYSISEELYNGSRTQVYRGYRKVDQQPVVVKLLKNPYPSFNELLLFRNQYTIARNLNSPLIVQNYSLEPYQNSYALVMEDFGGISLKEWGTRATQQSLEKFLVIAITLCNILDILYQERIIHKDIKPNNILINPETKQVKLIDFSIASLLPRETQTLINPNVLEGTLSYISPEQTGRMNRGIDYRTDFYSLGVTFYELLTGELPFVSNDPMELVHSHIAKIAPLVHEINSEIPSVLSKIVSKLMAKNAEDRYQNALALKFDLENCLHQLQVLGKIENFEIASRDVCDRFIIPDKLYGRENEVQSLLKAFERVADGSSELMLVAGFSGIGKTAVVNEVHKPITRQCGYFIKGKYDQFNRNIPFSAFVQAFRSLMGQILSASDIELAHWKEQILATVGENGQVLIEVIPELEYIIGSQPPIIELVGSASQNRFNLLFGKFIQVFTKKEHPLVIFLDDLQWADSASLNLLKLLMSESEAGYLLVLGAYRDNEVFPAHPLMLTLNEIRKGGVNLNTLMLAALNELDITYLVADTLQCSNNIAAPLSHSIYQKTQGNPFFTIQFLYGLHEEECIIFNRSSGYWQCDLTQMTQLALTDDVVEFTIRRLQRLPEATQQVLKLAACIGNRFDLETLAVVCEATQDSVAADLWPSLQEGLVIPENSTYKFFQGKGHDVEAADNITVSYLFLHDRVQQAAYSLIPETLRQATQFQIGKLLLANVSPEEQGSKIFAIVNHLNEGFVMHQSQEERSELLQLNLIAGKRAKESTAYGVAVTYFTVAERLLPPDSWQQCYEKTLDVYFNLAEVKYLSGDFQSSLAIVEAISSFARQQIERAEAFNLAILMFTLQGQYLQALQYGQKALSCLNFDLSEIDLPEKLESYQREIELKLGDRTVEQLVDEPESTDPEKRLIIKILNNLIVPVYVLEKGELYFVVALSMVSVSLNFGVIAESGNGFSAYGMYLGYYQSEYQSGYEFGVLAESLAKRFKQADNLCKACYMLGNNLLSWVRPLRCSGPIFDRGLVAGLQSGEMVFSGNLLMYKLLNSFYAGESLLEIQQNIPEYLEFCAKKLNYQLPVDVISGLNIALAELTASPAEDIPTEQQHLEVCKINNSDYAICHYLLLKTKILCFYGRYEEALESAQGAEDLVGTITGKYQVAAINFYQSIAIAEYCRSHSLGLDNSYIQKVKSNQAQLSLWAASCPENFAHKYDLVNAVLSVLSGQKTEAIELFDGAISGAKVNGYLQEEALANELAGKFCLEWGKEKFAAGYIQEAYYCYVKWGAKAKIADLERRYPQLLAPILQQTHTPFSTRDTIFSLPNVTSISSSTSHSTNVSVALDLAAILKASHTISGEIEFEKLLSSLLEIVIENAGADKCVFMLLLDDSLGDTKTERLLIKGSITTGSKPVVLRPIPIEDSQEIPHKLIYKVKHNRQTAVIVDASADLTLANDPYIIRQQPKSILCSPILHQGKLMGILYLENNLTMGAFTSDRIELLNLLCAQAAISLENSRLYERSQEYAQQLEQALHNLQQAQLQMIQSEKMSALGNLVAGVAHEMNNPLGFIAVSIKQAKPTISDLVEHLKLYKETLPDKSEKILDHESEIDLEYSLEDLPKMLDSMTSACDRLENISTSLRTFSRADRDYKVPFNIHEGIDSTILILKHRLKANEQRPTIEVVTNYGNLPQIECFPGQLNQVFMNILANAVDALEEANIGKSFAEIQAYPNCITITTSIIDHQSVKISIADNGKGMRAEVQEKIFDHLFTTKQVGKGTGLGLAIARQIVEEKHGGTITVNSVLGEGTEFIISLPI